MIAPRLQTNDYLRPALQQPFFIIRLPRITADLKNVQRQVHHKGGIESAQLNAHDEASGVTAERQPACAPELSYWSTTHD